MPDFPAPGRRVADPTRTAVAGYLWIPHLPLALALQQQPDAAGRPIIVGWDWPSEGVVVDASAECLAAGVRIGQPLREAREFCPRARFLPADPAADRRAQEAVLTLTETVAIAVEDDGVGRAYFALAGMGDPESGRRSLALLRTLILGRLGLRARLALAPGKFAARLAAEHGAQDGPVVVDDGMTYLAPFPITVLPLPPQTCERLRLLNITRVGQFAKLPETGLGRRFGPEAVRAHRLALGQDQRPISPRRQPEVRSVRSAFEPSVETLGPLLAVAERLLAELCQAVEAEGKACRGLRVALERADGRVVERTAALRRATAAPTECRTALRCLVQALAPGGPVVALTVTLADLGPARGDQLRLMTGTTTKTDRRQQISAAVQEVVRRYPARLHRIAPKDLPTLLDEHQFVLLPYQPDHGQGPEPQPGRLRAARRIRVVRRGARSYLVDGGRWDKLVAVHGSWRADEWWPAVVTRVYWRVRTSSGRVCTLSRDASGWRLVETLD